MKLDYVTGAYAVFVTVLAWDYLAPRLRLAQLRREIASRNIRDASRKRA